MAKRTKLRLALLLSVVALSSSAPAQAGILPKGTAPQKQRHDIAKQINKYWLCVLKAVAKCERDGGHSGLECDPFNVVALPPADPRGTFGASLDKCAEKLDFNKKGSGDPAADYVAMTCPIFPFGSSSTVDELQMRVRDGVRSQAALRVMEIDNVVCPFGDQSPFLDARQCVAEQLDVTIRFLKGLLKCEEKCENDYAGKKGNGGGTDFPFCFNLSEPNFAACVAKAVTTATKKTPALDPNYLSFLIGAYGGQTNAFYNYTCP